MAPDLSFTLDPAWQEQRNQFADNIDGKLKPHFRKKHLKHLRENKPNIHVYT